MIKKGEEYHIPTIIITFPQDEFSAVGLFRQKLIDFGKYTPSKPELSELPDWWKNPFVCTYGDQMIENKVGQYIDHILKSQMHSNVDAEVNYVNN